MTVMGDAPGWPAQGAVGPPPPPPGPGVQPPFVAPPTDGVVRRRWIGVWIAGALGVVLLLGGLLGYGALSVFGQQMIVDRSTTAVTEYLTAIRNGDYHKAFGGLCPAVRHSLDESTFADRLAQRAAVVSFTVGPPVVDANPIRVPVTVSYSDGSVAPTSYSVVSNGETGEFEVCDTGG